MPMTTADAIVRIRPNQRVDGIAAMPLPFRADGEPDFDGLAENLLRTSDAGLTPAVNMFSGFIELLTPAQAQQVLDVTGDCLGVRPFYAGAYVAEGSPDAYGTRIDEIRQDGGIPVLLPSPLIQRLDDASVIALHVSASRDGDLIAYEGSEPAVPAGRLYSNETAQELMLTDRIVGFVHASMRRSLEWDRLRLRDSIRSRCRVYTANEMAIDMTMYGSDHFLGVSALAPEAFALRDQYWERGDVRFYDLNDTLQWLGAFTFRSPFTGGRHTGAQFMRLRKRFDTEFVHPKSPRRSESDMDILQPIADRLARLLHAEHIHA